MFEVGELIIYGKTGVCRVSKIDTLDFKSAEKGRLYYILEPLFQTGMIFVPVDTELFMRPIITADKAKKLISLIPSIKAEAYYSKRLAELVAHYEETLGSHDCQELLKMLMSIYEKKCTLEERGCKFGQIDAKFMKRAEDLFYGELSVSLGIPKSEVPKYIAETLDNMEKGA